MQLYMCTGGKSMPAVHPCGKAAKALDDAGISYDVKTVQGALIKPWTWASRARDRKQVEEISGQRGVPVLVLDDGSAISGSDKIAQWAQEHAVAGA